LRGQLPPDDDLTAIDLEQRLKERANESADVSYTRKLLDRGVAHCAKKLGEEAVETVLAEPGSDHLVSEVADLWFHSMVLLAGDGRDPLAPLAELGRRRRDLAV
jgi:phosphoribosyl-ATP pyrophosphohydrolase